MRRLIVVLPVVCLAALVWPLFSTEPSPSGLDGLIVRGPKRHANLTVFPVVAETPRTADRFITLDEGLAMGTVEIFEVGADGSRMDTRADTPAANPPAQAQALPFQPQAVEQQVVPQQSFESVANLDGVAAGPQVNRLMVVNRSGKPLYLMAGEVIVGGQQDRTIAEETILASTGEPAAIDVFCVEHGRWSGRAANENATVLAALTLSDEARTDEQVGRLVEETARGKFVASAGSLSKASRLAAQSATDIGRGQSEVWDSVAQSNAASGVSPDSGAFTANYVDADNVKRLEPYLNRLQSRVADEPHVIGVVVAINGKVEAVDVFESTPLFRKLWPKLLKSYALDAAAAGQPGGRLGRPGIVAARDFLAKALTADVQDESHGQGGLVVQQRAAEGVVSFSAATGPAPESPSEAAGYGGGGLGRAVHAAAFAK